jgi:hypothetical protein
MEMRFIGALSRRTPLPQRRAISQFFEAVQFYRAFANFANARKASILNRYPQTAVQC